MDFPEKMSGNCIEFVLFFCFDPSVRTKPSVMDPYTVFACSAPLIPVNSAVGDETNVLQRNTEKVSEKKIETDINNDATR